MNVGRQSFTQDIATPSSENSLPSFLLVVGYIDKHEIYILQVSATRFRDTPSVRIPTHVWVRRQEPICAVVSTTAFHLYLAVACLSSSLPTKSLYKVQNQRLICFSFINVFGSVNRWRKLGIAFWNIVLSQNDNLWSIVWISSVTTYFLIDNDDLCL